MIVEIKNRIKLFKEGADTRNPSEIYFFIKKFFIICTQPTFGAYFNENWTWNWKVNHLLALIFTTGVFYATNAYENRGDSTEVWFSICLGMFVFSSLQRLHNFVGGHDKILETIKSIEDYIEIWEKFPESRQILLWYLRLLEKFILCGIVSIFLFGVLIALGPIIIYLVLGEMHLIYVCYIPYVDYTTHPGFEVHVMMHTWMAWCFCLSVVFFAGVVLIFLGMAASQIDILKMSLSVLSKQILDSKVLTEEGERDLHNIYQEHQKLIEFMDTLEELLAVQQLTDHFILGSQMCLSLFICYQGFWLPGYAILVVGTTILLTLDLFGTIIDMKFERLSLEVCNVPWYLMSLKNQKDYLFFLSNTQKTDRLTVGRMVPLCLNTFVRLYKGIYSYFMVLRETQV